MHILEAGNLTVPPSSTQHSGSLYFSVRSGEVAAIVGLNGSGKSTFLRMVAGMTPAGEGQISIDGRRLGRGDAGRDVKYLPQSEFIPKHLTLRRVFRDYGVGFDDFRRAFPHLNVSADARVKDLSGGERRLASIFAVLGSPSPFSLLDEPFSSLSPLSASCVGRLIEAAAAGGKGVVVTCCSPHDVADRAWSVYALTAGRLEKYAEPTLRARAERACTGSAEPRGGKEVLQSKTS